MFATIAGRYPAIEGAAGDALAETLPVLSTLAVIGAPTLDLPTSVRVCRPGEMQRPPLDWRQDGLHPLGSLLRP